MRDKIMSTETICSVVECNAGIRQCVGEWVKTHAPFTFVKDVPKELFHRLCILDARTPNDGTGGYISYNVPDKNRVKMKTQKFLVKKLCLPDLFGVNEAELREIATMVNTVFFAAPKFRLDAGEDITNNYRECVGGNSCMTGGCSRYTKLYEMNPDRFSMLVVTQFKDSARAIVHKLDNGKHLLDRVYCSSLALRDRMIGYALDKGWYYKDKDGDIFFDGYEVNEYEEFIVSNLAYCNGCVPYMDTLSGYYIDDGMLVIGHSCAGKAWDGELLSTEGKLNDEHYMYCEHCEEPYEEGELIWVTAEEVYVCNDCYTQYYMTCCHCEEAFASENGVVTQSGNTVCDNCADTYYRECDDCGELVLDGDIHEVCRGDEGSILHGEVCNVCFDKWYDKCGDCSVYHRADALIEVYLANGDTCKVCNDCVKGYQECPRCGKHVSELVKNIFTDEEVCALHGCLTDVVTEPIKELSVGEQSNE